MTESNTTITPLRKINRRTALQTALRFAAGGAGALLGQTLAHPANAADRSVMEYTVMNEVWQSWRDEERGHSLTVAKTTVDNTAVAAPTAVATPLSSPAPRRVATARTAPVAKTTSPQTTTVGSGASTATSTAAKTNYSTSYDVPTRLIIPAIGLDVPIQTVGITYSNGGAAWGSPAWRAAGWHNTSSRLGEAGNLVLNGHNNILGRVFAGLYNLSPGNLVTIQGANREVVYRLSHHLLLQEVGQPLSVLMENAKHILPTNDTRLTMVTCWPITNNTHRWIWVGYPTA